MERHVSAVGGEWVVSAGERADAAANGAHAPEGGVVRSTATENYFQTPEKLLTRRGVLWLGQTCNIRCHFCYFLDRIENKEHPEHQFMDIEKAKQICHTLRYKYGNTSIDIQGGEPTIWRHIEELITYCREIGLYPTLITNAITLARRERCEQLQKAGAARFPDQRAGPRSGVRRDRRPSRRFGEAGQGAGQLRRARNPVPLQLRAQPEGRPAVRRHRQARGGEGRPRGQLPGVQPVRGPGDWPSVDVQRSQLHAGRGRAEQGARRARRGRRRGERALLPDLHGGGAAPEEHLQLPAALL